MLRGGLLVVIATSVALTAAVETDSLKELLKNLELRYSTDVLEDASLNVTELITKYRYPLEVHSVTTEDGYILEMHRIPHGRDANNNPNKKRPAVFLMHGLLTSSADMVIMGPGTGLAYILAEEGFDVWMGNARGNTYSRKHVNPDFVSNLAYWRFSWDEIGRLDLPAMIDHALKKSGQERLHYIGHSQGTTTFFVMGSMRPEYNKKIISMHALAPVAYMAHNRSPLLMFISPHANNIESLANLFGVGEFLTNNAIYSMAGQAMCRDEVVFQPLCSNILFLIAGWNEQEHNATTLPIILGHAPAGVSLRQLAHYGQGIAGNEFRRYDQGSRLSNYRVYGSFKPPRYDLSKITTPVFLHYSDTDKFAHVNDVDRLFRELGRPIGKFRIPLASFSHVDFLYGINSRELLFNRVINLIRAMDANAFDDE
ncbi:lipase 1-like [Trichoplusia ni]|uniref:Lipase n=1 Tax=Trichoplusia ni TaxID=7111 RepID=A0A7E5VS12_TRINI|nr:lipase 1-like [Trichoplusia ni]